MPHPPITALTVRAIRATPVEVPPNFVLGTSVGSFRQVPLLLIDLETKEGYRPQLLVLLFARGRAGDHEACSARSSMSSRMPR